MVRAATLNDKTTSISMWSDRTMVFCICCLVYFSPISIALVEVFSTLILLAFLVKRSERLGARLKSDNRESFFANFCTSFKPVQNPLNIFVLCFVGANVISALLSQHINLSMKGFFGKIVQNIFIYIALIECINNKKRLWVIVSVLFLSIFIVSFAGIYQYYFGQEFLRGNLLADGRVSSSLRAPTDFAAYLVLFIPILMSFLIFVEQTSHPEEALSRGWRNQLYRFFVSKLGRLSLFLVFFIATISLGLTYSRGGWLAFGLGLFIFAKRKKKLMIPLGIFLTIFVIIFSMKMLDERMHINFSTLASSFGRFNYWQEAQSIIKDYPIAGSGLNTYSVVARDYKIDWGGYPHNCYFQMAAETGIVGLGAFLSMLFVIMQTGFKQRTKRRDDFLQSIKFGSTIGLAGFCFHSFFDTFFYSTQLSALMWVVIGIIMAVNTMEQDDKESNFSKESEINIVQKKIDYKILLIVFCVFVILTSLLVDHNKPNPKYGQVFLQTGKDCFEKCKATVLEKYFEKAIKHDPSLEEAYYYLGVTKIRLGKLEDAGPLFHKSFELGFRSSELFRYISLDYVNKGDWDKAYEYIFAAHMKDGLSTTYLYHLGYIVEMREEFGRAEYYYRQAAEYDPGLEEAIFRLGGVQFKLGKIDAAKGQLLRLRELKSDVLANQLEQKITQ